MPAFREDAIVFDDDRADGGIGRRPADTTLRFPKGETHEFFVDCGARRYGFKRTFCRCKGCLRNAVSEVMMVLRCNRATNPASTTIWVN